MTNTHGDFIWYELATSDADAAQRFYGELIGWTFTTSPTPNLDYRLLASKIADVGGIMALTPEMIAGGARPFWVGYLKVDDVDASVAAIKAAGGATHQETWDIPGIGRMAFMADSQGAMFYVMNPVPPEGQPDATSLSFAATEPIVGHCAWNELASTDPEGAKAFYSALFGWSPAGEMDMGPLGQYHMMRQADHMIAGIYAMVAEDTQSHWLAYFRVADLDHAVKQVSALGGTIHIPPSEIPGGEFSLVAKDPQGAFFGLVGPMKG